MVLKNALFAVLGATLLPWSSLTLADEYRPDQFLSLDLSKAVLSPKPLGPPAEFAPGPLDVNVDPGSGSAQAQAEPKAAAAKAAPDIVVPKVVPKTRIARLHREKPHGAARTRLVRRHGNPLDAQALDTRIQVWPCKSGGICHWKPQGR
jgi:hypothetical protein